MPKSRRRKRPKKGLGKVRMTADERQLLLRQREAFIAKFGREPGEEDPVFFDPTKDVPTPLDFENEVLDVMNQINAPPQLIYAYKKTGLMGFDPDKSRWPADRIQEWDHAVEEYFALQEAAKRPDRPDREAWTTEIPELLLSPFAQQDLDQVTECLKVIAPIEERGMKVVTRIELAAVLLAAACEHGYASGEETDGRGEGPELFALTEELVVRRAREIYAQGRV
jgi:hypothetical protein